MFPSDKSNLHLGGGGGKESPNEEGGDLIVTEEEKKEQVQVLTSRVAHICCYLCVISPLQIAISLSENGW